MRWSQQQSYQILRPLLSGLCYLVQCIKCIKWIKWIKCIQWKETRHDSMYLDMIFELPWTEPYGTTDWRCLTCFGQRLFHKHWGTPRNKNHSKKHAKDPVTKDQGSTWIHWGHFVKFSPPDCINSINYLFLKTCATHFAESTSASPHSNVAPHPSTPTRPPQWVLHSAIKIKTSVSIMRHRRSDEWLETWWDQSMHGCMFVCMHACMHVCMYVCTHSIRYINVQAWVSSWFRSNWWCIPIINQCSDHTFPSSSPGLHGHMNLPSVNGFSEGYREKLLNSTDSLSIWIWFHRPRIFKWMLDLHSHQL